MTAAAHLTLGEPLNDAELVLFHGASNTEKCIVVISKETGEPVLTGNCEGVTVKDR